MVFLSDQFVCASCKPMAIQRIREGIGLTSVNESEAVIIRQSLINHETSIRSVGFLYIFFGCFFTLIILSQFVLLNKFLYQNSPVDSRTFVIVFLPLLFVAIGFSIRKLRKWTRIPVAIFSSLGLLGFPLGTIFNGYILYLFFCQKGTRVFSDEYKEIIQITPQVRYKTSKVVKIIGLIVIGALLLLAILGFTELYR